MGKKRPYERRVVSGKRELTDRDGSSFFSREDESSRPKRSRPESLSVLVERLVRNDYDAIRLFLDRKSEPGARKKIDRLASKIEAPSLALRTVMSTLGGRANRAALERITHRLAKSKSDRDAQNVGGVGGGKSGLRSRCGFSRRGSW